MMKPYGIGGIAMIALCLTTLTIAGATPTETLLHVFNGTDGVQPVADLVMDSAGNLYGTTDFGGAMNLKTCPGAAGSNGGLPAGCGVIFKLSPPAKGQTGWTQTVLHGFAGPDGVGPEGGLNIGKDGSLYGVTYFGGGGTACPGKLSIGVPAGCGVVFKLSPPTAAKKTWTETILHRFSGPDGANAKGKLTIDSAGDVYGITFRGGSGNCPANAAMGVAAGCGTVFKLSHPVTGTAWTYAALHKFGTGTDGKNPSHPPILDSLGNLYGLTTAGGAVTAPCPANLADGTAAGCGVVYKLTIPKTGKTGWTETLLSNLPGAAGPASPHAGLVLGKDGALYATSTYGGTVSTAKGSGFGTIFKLAPPARNTTKWTLETLHKFDSAVDGANPLATLSFDAAGNLYGTAANDGGNSGVFPSVGTVFELVAPKPGKTAWTEKILHKFGLDSLPTGALPESGVIRDTAGNLYGTTAASYGPGYVLGPGAVYKITP